MKYVLIRSVDGHGHWYYFESKADMFRMWQLGGECTMWQIVGDKMIQLVA